MATPTNGIIEEPSKDDVICGRGGKSNHHPGNMAFRAIIADRHVEYLQCNRSKKTNMTVELLRDFRAAGVRFLRVDDTNHHGGPRCWIDVGDRLARTKISQALRDSTTTTTSAVSSPITSNDDQSMTGDTSGKKRKTVATPPNHPENRNTKRAFVLHDTTFHEIPTPAIAPSSAATSTQLREVSPVPSRTSVAPNRSLLVPSLVEIGPSLQHYNDGEKRHDPPVVRTSIGGDAARACRYHVSPMEATLFELLEHEDNDDKFSSIAVSSSSSRWSVGGSFTTRLSVDRHNPFVLPDLPSRDDAPLRLPSIGVKIRDVIDASSTHHDESASVVLDKSDQFRPLREVSPISFGVIPSPQHQTPIDRHGGSGGDGVTTMRRSWTPATFAMLNEEPFDDYLFDIASPGDHHDDVVLGPHFDDGNNNNPVLSPSRRPETCSNDDENDHGWTSSSSTSYGDDSVDDDDVPADAASCAPTATTTVRTFERTTFSAFSLFATAGN